MLAIGFEKYENQNYKKKKKKVYKNQRDKSENC